MSRNHIEGARGVIGPLRLRACAVALVALTAIACGGDETVAPTTMGGGGGCSDELCDPMACADGFVADAFGCLPILPDEPCLGATMALPGDTSCSDISSCGDAPWGDIPLEANTIYVDGSFSGGSPDGSAGAPFTTVRAALQAAPAGAIVAIADGQYDGTLIIDAPVRLWGRCAANVEIRPADAFSSAVALGAGAGGSEFRNITVAGTLELNSSALFEQSIVRQAPAGGIFALREGSDIVLRQSILDDNGAHSVVVFDSNLTIESSVVRADAADSFGPVVLETGPLTVGANLTVRGSVLEGLTAYGALVVGAQLHVEASAIRNVRSDGEQLGDGVVVAATDSGIYGSGDVVDSFIGSVTRAGIANFLCDTSLERVRLECNTIDINGETTLPASSLTRDYTFDDRGGNSCGCGDERTTCSALSSGLAPPQVLP